MSTPTFDLKNRVVIVTGSTKGIGQGIAQGLALSGANVVIVSRSDIDCNHVAEEINDLGGNAIAFATDLTKLNGINALVAKTLETYGSIDILVNNAGAAILKKAEELT